MPSLYLVGISNTSWLEKYSGEINRDRQKNFRIGGVVFKDLQESDLFNQLSYFLQEWNAEQAHAQMQGFRELHYFALRKRNPHMTPPPNTNMMSTIQGLKFTKRLVSELNKQSYYSFVSGGFLPFFTYGHQAYFELVRIVLWGLLKKELQLAPQDKVVLYIAPMLQLDGIASQWRASDSGLTHHSLFLAQLQQEFAAFAESKEVHIEFVCEQDHLAIMAAEFMLGNHKTREIPVYYRKISVNDYYTACFGDNPAAYINASYRQGNCSLLQACLQILHCYSLDVLAGQEESPLLAPLKELLKELGHKGVWLEEFIKIIENIFQSLLASRVQDAQNLKLAEIYCDTLTQQCPFFRKNEQETRLCLRLEEILLRNQIGIAAHKGTATTAAVDTTYAHILTYRKFFEENKQKIYATIGERMKSLLDMELKAIHVTHFNCYNFGEIPAVLAPHHHQYQLTYHTALTHGERDALFAKLCGTLGQAYAFIYAQSQDNKDYRLAAGYLQEDTQNLQKGPEWSQGMHYRIHLELTHQDMPKALSLLQELWEEPKLTPESLLGWGIGQLSDWEETALVWNLALLLKVLGYYRHLTTSFTISHPLLNTILNLVRGKTWQYYPTCNVCKWLAYLYGVDGDKEQAFSVLTMVGSCKEKDFTSQTFDIPVMMIKAFCKTGNAQSITKKVESFMTQQPYFKAYLEARRWQEKFPVDALEKWNLWEMATLLPFYYA